MFFSIFIFHNFNNSVFDASFPSKLKNADVIPSFKKKDWNNVENYRPVNTFPYLLKIYMKGASTIKCINVSIIYSLNANVDYVKALAHNTVFL